MLADLKVTSGIRQAARCQESPTLESPTLTVVRPRAFDLNSIGVLFFCIATRGIIAGIASILSLCKSIARYSDRAPGRDPLPGSWYW